MEKEQQEEIIKVKYDGDPFTMIPNELLLNPDINVNTRLLYGIIKRYITIPDFKLYKSTLRKALGCGSNNTFDKYWKDLKKLGLLEQKRIRNDNGRWGYEYILHTTYEQPHPKKWGMEKPHPKKWGTENMRSQNVDAYNNTDLNNININNNKDLDLTDSNSFYKIPFTKQQEKDINRLIQEVGIYKINSTKEDLFNYIIKLYKNDFKDHNGKPIKSLYAVVHAAFSKKTKRDQEEKEFLQKKAQAGDPYAAEALEKIFY